MSGHCVHRTAQVQARCGLTGFSEGTADPMSESGAVSQRLVTSDCAFVPRRIEEALEALRGLDGRRAEAILVELLEALEEGQRG